VVNSGREAEQRVVRSEVEEPNMGTLSVAAECSSVGRMCTWLSQEWWAAVQVCGTVELANPAGGRTPVTRSRSERRARRPALRPSVVTYPKRVVRHSIQWRQSRPRSGGFGIGWAETAARGVAMGGRPGNSQCSTGPRARVHEASESPPRRLGPCGQFKQPRYLRGECVVEVE
jgi:hypothetical protein